MPLKARLTEQRVPQCAHRRTWRRPAKEWDCDGLPLPRAPNKAHRPGVPVGRSACPRRAEISGQNDDTRAGKKEAQWRTAEASTPRWTRTSNLRFRRPMLYPIELAVPMRVPCGSQWLGRQVGASGTFFGTLRRRSHPSRRYSHSDCTKILGIGYWSLGLIDLTLSAQTAAVQPDSKAARPDPLPKQRRAPTLAAFHISDSEVRLALRSSVPGNKSTVRRLWPGKDQHDRGTATSGSSGHPPRRREQRPVLVVILSHGVVDQSPSPSPPAGHTLFGLLRSGRGRGDCTTRGRPRRPFAWRDMEKPASRGGCRRKRGRRDSNPQPPDRQSGTRPIELRPRGVKTKNYNPS